MSQRLSRFAGRGASNCHGSTSSALATFAIQSSVGLVANLRTAKTCERDTPAKSASAVRAIRLRFAVARTFRATSVRNSRGSTPPTLRGVRHHGMRYPGWSRGPRAAVAGRMTGRAVPMDRRIARAALALLAGCSTTTNVYELVAAPDGSATDSARAYAANDAAEDAGAPIVDAGAVDNWVRPPSVVDAYVAPEAEAAPVEAGPFSFRCVTSEGTFTISQATVETIPYENNYEGTGCPFGFKSSTLSTTYVVEVDYVSPGYNPPTNLIKLTVCESGSVDENNGVALDYPTCAPGSTCTIYPGQVAGTCE
jgi:hypothetical protein